MAQRPLTERLNDALRGRNGADELGTAAICASFILLLIALFAGVRWLTVPATALACYSWWRTSSRNVTQRRAENRAFMRKVRHLTGSLKSPRATVEEHKEYKHLTCPECHQRVRVPRGKGKLRVTCPSCHTKFDARS